MKLKIVFLVGSVHVGGGTYVIFQHALGLKRAGHDVYIVTEDRVTLDMVAWHPEAQKELSFYTYSDVSTIDFDVTFATWWKTVYFLHLINSKVYAYFVQSIESRFFDSHEHAARLWAEATYTYNLPIITEATWIQKYLKENYSQDSQLVLNGIRKDIYTSDGASKSQRAPGKLRVLVEGPLGVFFKNTEKTIELIQKSLADEIWFMTSNKNMISYPGIDKLFCCIPINEAAEVYRSCDVIVKLSYVEGMFGPPLEAFHCGATAIVYEVTGHDLYIKDGINAIVLKKDDEEGVIKAINSLARNSKKLEKLKAQALETASSWPSWECSSAEFVKATEKLATMKSESKATIAGRNKVLSEWFDKHQSSLNLLSHL